MNNSKRLKLLLREFVNEVVIAGEFKDDDIRPIGNYRPDDNYRRTDNYRVDDPKAFLGMTKPAKEPQGDDEYVDPESPEGAADGGSPKMGDQKNQPFNSFKPNTQQTSGDDDSSTEPNTQEPAIKKPEWKNPLL